MSHLTHHQVGQECGKRLPERGQKHNADLHRNKDQHPWNDLGHSLLDHRAGDKQIAAHRRRKTAHDGAQAEHDAELVHIRADALQQGVNDGKQPAKFPS